MHKCIFTNSSYKPGKKFMKDAPAAVIINLVCRFTKMARKVIHKSTGAV